MSDASNGASGDASGGPPGDALGLAGHKLGNYRLRRILGHGNMGVVYLATDEALLRPTAVKVLAWSPSEYDPVAWFLAEARSVARLNHPSVVQIYSVARHGPYCYIAMEYVDGVSADVLVSRDGPFAAERATEIILQLAGALELAHAAGIIHRDVKPGNILIKHDGTAKLGDFGTAVSATAQDKKAKPAVRAGTPHYFAPEIWRGEPASIASDLYALGATYYYLLTGRPPLDAPTMAGLGAAHLHQPVVAPRELTGPAAACMRVIARCMAKPASERYESARAVAWEVRGVLRELEAMTLSVTPTGELAARRFELPPALRAAEPAWRARGFEHEPFAALDPSAPPYRGAPFEAVRGTLATRLAQPGTTVILAGAPRSGRSTLARWVVSASAEHGAYIDLAQPSAQQGSLARRIARAFGAVASPSAVGSAALEGLLDALAGGSAAQPARLVVIDGVVPGTRAAADAAVLARAARSTRYFSMLVLGPAELAADLADPSRPNPAAAVVTLPALRPPEVRDYLASWLAVTRLPEAPPLIVTVDAALLVAHRTEGNLGRINALARELFATGGPIVTSWDAWTSPDGIGQRASDRETPPVRPAGWPTPDIVGLINQCRAAAGIAPLAVGPPAVS